MDNTLSDYDLIDRMKKERQNEIDKLRREKERLRATIELIKSRGMAHGVEWCVTTASGALESEEE